jgi:4'-phosphopantetheinyl transferase
MTSTQSVDWIDSKHSCCTLLVNDEVQPQPDEVHIWSASLIATQDRLKTFFATLSKDERKRAKSFVRVQDKNRYIIARGILRELLGNYLGITPEQVSFSYGTYGKPYLTEALADDGLEFNLSHAANSAVYVFANRRQVGIDIEPLNKKLAWRELAPIIFSKNELLELDEIPEEGKMKAFFRGWARKEAFVKGCGLGFSLDIKAFNVPLRQLETPSYLETYFKFKHQDIWHLYPIDPIAGFVSALTVKGNLISNITMKVYPVATDIFH